MTASRRIPLALAAATAGVVGTLWAVTGLALDDFEYAWEVLIGVASPFERSRWFTVALSASGYLVLPIFVGIGVSAWVSSLIKGRLISREEARDLLREEIAKVPNSKAG